MKSGKFTLGLKTTLKCLRSGKSEFLFVFGWIEAHLSTPGVFLSHAHTLSHLSLSVSLSSLPF